MIMAFTMNEKDRLLFFWITERDHLDWETMEGLQGIELTTQKLESKYISKKGNTIYLLYQYLGESRDATKVYFHSCL